MDSAWLVPAALAFGIVVGAGVFAIVLAAARRGQRAVDVVSTAVPDGVDQVLDLGPGSALAEMASAAMPDARVRAVDQFRTLQGVRDWLVLHDR